MTEVSRAGFEAPGRPAQGACFSDARAEAEGVDPAEAVAVGAGATV